MKEIQVNKTLPIINMNFEEVKASLEETLSKFENLVVTDENLKDCKATQKDLSKLGRDIDTYRKGVKKEMEAPIKSFENQCKELVAMVDQANKPIKDGIAVYDDKKRVEKVEYANQIIALIIVNLGLEPKYAQRLVLDPSYSNLTTTKKFIKENIESRAERLKQEQDQEHQRKEMIKKSIDAAVAGANETLGTPLKAEDFYQYIERGFDLAQCINMVNSQATKLRRAEEAAKEKAIREEQERIRQEELAKLKAEEPAKTPEVKEEVKPVEQVKTPEPTPVQNTQPKDQRHFFIKATISHDCEHMRLLSSFLKDNGFNLCVEDKGLVK